MRETTLKTPRSVKKDEREVLQAPEQKFPHSPSRGPWWKQAAPLQPVAYHSRADLHSAACGGAHSDTSRSGLKEAVAYGGPRLGKAPGRKCNPMERSSCRNRLPARNYGYKEPPHWSSLFLKDCILWKRSMLENFLKNCSPWEGLMLEEFMKDCIPWEECHIALGKGVRSKEQQSCRQSITN